MFPKSTDARIDIVPDVYVKQVDVSHMVVRRTVKYAAREVGFVDPQNVTMNLRVCDTRDHPVKFDQHGPAV